MGTASWRRAHPRSRGENGLHGAFNVQRAGSSPLTRGKRAAVKAAQSQPGLIPAHAGKTSSNLTAPSPSWAHPRSRGENKDGAGASLIRWGSSPLTRGKQAGYRGRVRRRGLIPAHAGKTARRDEAPPTDRGSSPLTRGKRTRAAFPPTATGLIPAHAGKTVGGLRCWQERGAHPRSRGENAYFDWVATIDEGSSPLTRGKQPLIDRFFVDERLIPAHAGKTRSALS